MLQEADKSERIAQKSGINRVDKNIPESSIRAALIALNRAIDAFCEAEAGHRIAVSAQLLRAYSRQTSDTTKVLVKRARLSHSTVRTRQLMRAIDIANGTESLTDTGA